MNPLERLEDVLRPLGTALVALSGGVDSAVVALAAHRALGSGAVALTAHSPSLPDSELAEARAVAARIGIAHRVVDTRELEREGYQANAGNRCYFCKTELYDQAEALRAELGLAFILDGTLPSDLRDTRPGLVAAAEHRVRHPLVEAGVDKPDVRDIARAFGLPVWDKPSFACLGSRFPVGTRVSFEKLQRVGAAELALRQLGFRRARVRWHEIGEKVLARIELDPGDLARVLEHGVREQVVEAAQAAGFAWVTLDLVGYRSPTGMG